MANVKIIQIMAIADDEAWQGHILGLGSDGVVYFDKGDEWAVYMPLKFRKEAEK